MNISQEIRRTLIKSGDRMSVAEITDAIGGLADKSFVHAICSQQFKKKVFGRTMEDGRMVYWIIDPKAAPANDEHMLEEKGADSAPVVQPEIPAAAADPAVVEEPVAPAVKVVQPERLARPKTAAAKVGTSAADHVHAQAAKATSTTAQLDDMVGEIQSERILRMERTSHNLQRLLSNLLSDAIDARLEHEVLSRLSTAQLAVQDVHGFLANGA